MAAGKRTAQAVGRGAPVDGKMLALSCTTAFALLALFLFYLSFRFLTHGQLFLRNPSTTRHSPGSPADGMPEAATLEPLALGLGFAGSIACTAASAHFLLGSLKGSVGPLHATNSFIGLVVLPLAAGLAKSVAIVRHARSPANPGAGSGLDFAIRSVMTNVLDTVLFIMPLLVLLGWAVGRPMLLDFGLFEMTVLLLAIMIMTSLVQHGKTTYFEGFMLMVT
ncbi:hypothetical protein CDD83_10118 [Cordyceps sp. RAO-2017]|nr:hypothetical protein CDD83_10118 [Cordyceps sp. RAO-2017]